MNEWRMPALQRAVLALWLTVFLLPTLVACAAPRATGSPGYPGTPAAAAQAELAGIVVGDRRLSGPNDSGGVRVIRDGVALLAYTGMALHRGDRIETGPSAEAVIRYASGTELFLRPRSGGRIGSFTEFVGEVFAKIKGAFSVDTTFVSAGARGTAYLVRADPGGATTVIVFEGRVAIDSTTGAWPGVEMGRGTMTQAYPRPPVAVAAHPDDLQRTRDWVERLERLVPESGGSSGGTAAAVGIAVLVAALLAASSSDRDDDRERDRERDRDRDRSPPIDPRRPPAPIPRLEAPDGATPGHADPRRAPVLDCRSPLTLRWRAVDGARYYDIDVEVLPPGARRWQTLPAGDTRATWTRLRAGLQGLVRWSVTARNDAGAGPASTRLTLRCSSPIVR